MSTGIRRWYRKKKRWREWKRNTIIELQLLWMTYLEWSNGKGKKCWERK